MKLIDERIERYAFEHTRPAPETMQELEKRTHREMDLPQMLTGRVEGGLLKMLVQLCRPALVLEVGTFTGYSALSMAAGLEDEARLITCEIDPKAAAIAQAAFDAVDHGRRIEIRMGPALDTIRSLSDPIDFSFIDADKEGYPQYYEEILERTRPGGLLVFDNMLMDGRILDPQDPGTKAVAGLNETLTNDDRVENVLLTVRDGIQCVRKKTGVRS